MRSPSDCTEHLHGARRERLLTTPAAICEAVAAFPAIREAVAAFRAICADEVMLYFWSPDAGQVERLADAAFGPA